MNVAVFGAGYVGSVSAACLAHLGHRVWLVEVSEEKLAMLREGRTPVAEPGLDEMLGGALRSGAVRPTACAEGAIAETEIALVCVSTPSSGDGGADLSHVRRVCDQLAGALAARPGPYVIALRSTVPYPQLEADLLPVLRKGPVADRFGREILFALNPEFLREGNGIEDFLGPPYIVVGTDDPGAVPVFRQLYGGIPAALHVVSPGTASLLKYACNAFHGLKVAFANEIAGLERAFRADGNAVMEILCQDRVLNISPAYLRPGYAFGGSCLPKDLRALTRVGQVHGTPTPLLSAVLPSNESTIARSLDLIAGMRRRRVGFIGLSFKAGTDDLRESPLVELAERLMGKGFEVRIFDPDVRVDTLQGRNLGYIQQHLPHLASLLVERLEDLAPNPSRDGALIVLGKPLVAPEQLVLAYPPGTPVVDLARSLPPDLPPLEVVRP